MKNNKAENAANAIDFIEDNLTEPLNLSIVAEAVHYSKYYLHRIFREVVGMTVHDYAQRRRLTEAAKLLVFSDRSILDIALLAGYESQQAFTAVFTDMYKLPPNRFRENEEFYPLQLAYTLKTDSVKFQKDDQRLSQYICYAEKSDIPAWMELVHLVIDGFPHLDEAAYVRQLKDCMEQRRALILKGGTTAVGILIFSSETGSIDFLGIHPQYRQHGIAKAFLDKMINGIFKGKTISITTFREGDRADTGYRAEYKKLGFAESELLMEFGYPTQRFILKGKNQDHHDPVNQ